MGGVADTTTIDSIGHEAETDEYHLLMSETRPWGSDPRQLEQLAAKLRNYRAFVSSGQLARMHPESVGRPVGIILYSVDAPDQAATAVLDEARAALAEDGVSVMTRLLELSTEEDRPKKLRRWSRGGARARGRIRIGRASPALGANPEARRSWLPTRTSRPEHESIRRACRSQLSTIVDDG